MFTLRPERLRDLSLPIGTSWLLADCMEARGKQDLWMRQKPEAIEALRERFARDGIEPYRAEQIASWLYRRGVDDPE